MQQLSNSGMETKNKSNVNIVFLILPKANMFDFAGASQVFHESCEQGLKASLHFCSYEKEIHTSTSVPLGQLNSYKKYSPGNGDVLFIVSADYRYVLSPQLNPEPELLQWIVNAHENGATICALCNGAFLLGKTGLLDNRHCTTHWRRTNDLQKKFPFAKVQENILFIEDHGIITSAGATSGIDVALYILGKLKDDHFVHRVSRELVIYNRRSGSHLQQSVLLSNRNHVHLGIHKTQDYILENIHKDTSVSVLSEIAAMSERNFTRIFKKETGLTVNEYVTQVRKEKISELIQKPNLSRAQIAKQCGLRSERQVARILHSD